MGPEDSDVESTNTFLTIPDRGSRPRMSVMPLVNVYCSAPAPTPDTKKQLLVSLSALLAREVGKPESYVMTSLVPRCDMTFGGSFDPACFVEIKNIGHFKPEQTKRISAKLCEMLQRSLGVSAGRIYIEFSDATGYLWGHDGTTFG